MTGYVHEYPIEAFVWDSDAQVIGQHYHAGAMVLDWRWSDDDHLDFLLVEEDGEWPFVAIRVHADALDVRTDLWRQDTIRYALISWENML